LNSRMELRGLAALSVGAPPSRWDVAPARDTALAELDVPGPGPTKDPDRLPGVTRTGDRGPPRWTRPSRSSIGASSLLWTIAGR
jgi:hypothetical protein